MCVLLGGRKETLWSGSRHVRQVSLVVTGESYCHLNFMFQLGDVKSELADIWIQFKIRHILSCYYLLLVILNLPGLGVFFVTLEQTVQKVCFSTWCVQKVCFPTFNKFSKKLQISNRQHESVRINVPLNFLFIIILL